MSSWRHTSRRRRVGRNAGGATASLGGMAGVLQGVAAAVNQPAFQTGLTAFFTGINQGTAGVMTALPAIGSAFAALGPVIGQVAAIVGPVLGVALQQVASIRGATQGLMSKLVEGHVREHVAVHSQEAARELEPVLEILRGYLK